MDNSSASQSQHNDIQKLHAIWKSIKQQKKNQQSSHSQSQQKPNKRPSLGYVKHAIHEEEQKNLQARLSMTQNQLIKSRQNTALLMKKLSQAEQEIQYLQFELEKQKRGKADQNQEVQALRIMLEENTRKEETFGMERAKENFDENNKLKGELEAYERKINFNEKEINRLCLKVKSLQLDKKNHEAEFTNLHQLNESLRKQLAEAENAFNQIYLGQQSKGTQLLELNEATKTIERLVLLLRGTEEYRLFGDFAQEVKDIHFLKNIPRRMKHNQLNHHPPEKRKLCSCMEVKIDERLLWTTAASYKIFLDMKIKYESLTEDCIEEILFELNKIWLGREEAHVRRVKEAYETEIIKLKKKGQIRYDEMVARKQIQRLKKELQGVKNTKKAGKGPTMDTLKNVGQYEDELRVKEKQIKLLQERIRLIETESGTCDKALYLEGALWIIDKVLAQLYVNDQDIRQFESHFREKIRENLSTDDWVRSYKQFFQSITELQNGLTEKLLTMKESTLRKVSNQKTTLKKSHLKAI